MENHGLNLELEQAHRSPEDWTFGASSLPSLDCIPEALRFPFLPVGEIQKGKDDMMDCATRAPVNKLETDYTWFINAKKISQPNIEWLHEKGYVDEAGRVTFSDAFVAINSGTTRQGNSLIAPLDAIHRQGLIPKKMLPLESWMRWEDYHDPKRITPEMYALGLEFVRRFTINYERVSRGQFAEALENDMLVVAGFAWPSPKNGEYPRVERVYNHAFLDVVKPLHNIFDNYPDTLDGDFVKKLASDYDLYEYAYRIFVSSETATPVRRNPYTEIFISIWKAIKDLWRR